IDQLERSFPELEAGGAKSTNAQTKATASDSAAAGTPATLTTNRRSQPSGILGLAEELFSITHRINTIDRRTEATDALAQAAQKLQAPVVADLVGISQRGEEAAKQADVSGPDQLKQLKQELDALNANFEQASTVALPLAKQKILFNLYKSNLARWRSSVKNE